MITKSDFVYGRPSWQLGVVVVVGVIGVCVGFMGLLESKVGNGDTEQGRNGKFTIKTRVHLHAHSYKSYCIKGMDLHALVAESHKGK